MNLVRPTILLALWIFGVLPSAFAATNAQALYETHQWFELRELASNGAASVLHRGAVACAFENASAARTIFQPLMDTNAASEEAYAAHQWLNYAYLRNGQYRHCLAELKAMLALHTDDDSLKSAQLLFEALSIAPEQSVAKRARATVKYKKQMGLMFPSIQVNGHPAHYFMDCGANISMISEGEAKRVGMKIHSVRADAIKTLDATGAQAAFQIAVADEVAFGGFSICNVAFMVFPDDRKPWHDMAQAERGALGISVWLALDTLRIHRDGTFDAGYSAAKIQREPNLCFDGATPIARVGFEGRHLPVLLDSGAVTTDFWPPFARDFPGLMRQGKPGSRKISGVGSSVTFQTIDLPEVKLDIGGFKCVRRPAHVLPEKTAPESEHYFARLGWDLLAQAPRVTICFETMTMLLE